MGAILWPFLIYWVAMFVACYTVLEVGQNQLYDEVTPRSGLKVAGGSFVLAALLTWLRPSFDTMFTSDLAWTVLQAIVWSGVFILIFQFQPLHGAVLGTLTMLVVSGLATMGVQSLIDAEVRTVVAPVAEHVQGDPPADRPEGRAQGGQAVNGRKSGNLLFPRRKFLK